MMYTVKELMEEMNISKNTAYKLIHTNGFPCVRIGSKYLIDKDGLEKWIKRNTNREIKI